MAGQVLTRSNPVPKHLDDVLARPLRSQDLVFGQENVDLVESGPAMKLVLDGGRHVLASLLSLAHWLLDSLMVLVP